MSGIYIHIPFCRQKCHYCNFHFSVSLKNKGRLLNAIMKEIELTHDFLETDKIETLYFGGGTPSILEPEELKAIIGQVKKYFDFSTELELTLEANPDDMVPTYLSDIRKLGVNRLSVGIQSFFDDELIMMNRSHNADQAKKAFQIMKETGFQDYSVDLIFGMPNSNLDSWKQNLDVALSFQAPHFSFYNLTVEPKTALEHMIRQGKINALDGGDMADQFLFTMEYMERAGYDHYEISNYSLPGRYAKHNTAYWKGKAYLGIGPSAHSFKQNIRQWNMANNPRYIKAIEAGKLASEKELLSIRDQYNEYIMTGLRTMWGIESGVIKTFGKRITDHFKKMIVTEKQNRRVIQRGDIYVLSKEGKLFADEVARELFVES